MSSAEEKSQPSGEVEQKLKSCDFLFSFLPFIKYLRDDGTGTTFMDILELGSHKTEVIMFCSIIKSSLHSLMALFRSAGPGLAANCCLWFPELLGNACVCVCVCVPVQVCKAILPSSVLESCGARAWTQGEKLRPLGRWLGVREGKEHILSTHCAWHQAKRFISVL